MKQYKKRAMTYTIVKNKTDVPIAKITSSKDSNDYIKKYLFDKSIDVYESAWILLLNSNNNVTGFVKISQGGINSCIIDPRLIAKYAIDELAVNVILAHNHPSGNITPSEEDKHLTRKVKEGLQLFNITLLDHLIVTSENEYYSFADKIGI